jgi:putative holliday junction resolvase
VSDPLGITAQPLFAVEARDTQKAFAEIAEVCEEKGVTLIVVGLPLQMKGTEGQSAAEARRFAETLKARLQLPLEMWDERLSTAQAERAMLDHDLSRARRKIHRDAMAAQIFLQSYLDAHRRPKEA